MQLIFVQLLKVPLIDVKDMSLLEKWSFFLKYFEDEGKQSIIKEVIKQEEGIAMADKIIKYMTRNGSISSMKLSLIHIYFLYFQRKVQ